jgi:hypothetical protein
LAVLNGTNNAIVKAFPWGTDLSGSMQGAGGVSGLIGFSSRQSPVGTHFVAYGGNGGVKESTLLFSVGALSVVATILFVFTCGKDPTPSSVTRPTLDSVIDVHGSPEQGLRICAKTFREVKG